ncbi:MAG: hypothetical protein ABI389_03670 [Rhodanobacter sp.]
MGKLGVAAIVLGGVLVHAVLMGSLMSCLHGLIGVPVLLTIQLVNMGVPLTVVLVFHRMKHGGQRRMALT